MLLRTSNVGARTASMADAEESERIARLLAPSRLPADIRESVERAVRLSGFLRAPWFFFGPKWRRGSVDALDDADDRLLDLMERVEKRCATLDAFLQDLDTSAAPDAATTLQRLSTWIDGALNEVASWPSSFADSLDAILADGSITASVRSLLVGLRDETASFAMWLAQAHDAGTAWRLLQHVSDCDLPMRQALYAARDGHLNEAELVTAVDLVIAERRRCRVSG